MTIEDAKVGAVSALSVGVKLAGIESVLTIAVLIASLIYTVQKIRQNHRNWKNSKK